MKQEQYSAAAYRTAMKRTKRVSYRTTDIKSRAILKLIIRYVYITRDTAKSTCGLYFICHTTVNVCSAHISLYRRTVQCLRNYETLKFVLGMAIAPCPLRPLPGSSQQ